MYVEYFANKDSQFLIANKNTVVNRKLKDTKLKGKGYLYCWLDSPLHIKNQR